MQQTVTSRHGCSDLRLTRRIVANRSVVAFLIPTEVQNYKNHNKGATIGLLRYFQIPMLLTVL
jgi:hypothetical protein